MVWEEDTTGVPSEVLRCKGEATRTEEEPLTLVQFYDKSRSWYVIRLETRLFAKTYILVGNGWD